MATKTISFKGTIYKIGVMAEKTGWTVVDISSDLAQQLNPNNRKSFKVKGTIDNHKISGVSLLPMGRGNFIMPLNAAIRKAIAKNHGATVTLTLAIDQKKYQLNKTLAVCLNDDPAAKSFFQTLAPSHQNYFSKWIDTAKTDATKSRRIAQALFGLSNKMDFSQMVRYHKQQA